MSIRSQKLRLDTIVAGVVEPRKVLVLFPSFFLLFKLRSARERDT